MTTTHTPGPWFADKLQDRNAYNIFPAGATYALLTVAAPGHDGAHPCGQATEANARLIAAAPDLLAALQSALSDAKPAARREYWRDGADGESSELVREETWPDWIDAARAAIAAATGGA